MEAGRYLQQSAKPAWEPARPSVGSVTRARSSATSSCRPRWRRRSRRPSGRDLEAEIAERPEGVLPVEDAPPVTSLRAPAANAATAVSGAWRRSELGGTRYCLPRPSVRIASGAIVRRRPQSRARSGRSTSSRPPAPERCHQGRSRSPFPTEPACRKRPADALDDPDERVDRESSLRCPDVGKRVCERAQEEQELDEERKSVAHFPIANVDCRQELPPARRQARSRRRWGSGKTPAPGRRDAIGKREDHGQSVGCDQVNERCCNGRSGISRRGQAVLVSKGAFSTRD